MRKTWSVLLDSVLSSPHHTPGVALPKPGWTAWSQRKSSWTASAPVLDVSAFTYTNGLWPLCGLWVSRGRPNHWPCCLPMSDPSTTARPDGFGWWDNRMAAQLLSRDLVWPSRGLKELSQTIVMKHLVLAYCRHYHLNLPCCTVFYVLNKLRGREN